MNRNLNRNNPPVEEELLAGIAELKLEENELRLLREQIEQLIRRRTEHLQKVNAQLEATIQGAREYAENIVESVRDPIVILDSSLRIVSANEAFYKTFKVNSKETEGEFIYDLGNHQWDIPRLRELLERILPEKAVFNGFEVEHNFESLGHRTMLLNARQIYRKGEEQPYILLFIEDITDRKEEEQRLQKLREELERSNTDLQQFAYIASHDLKEPLRNITSFVGLLEKRYKDNLDEKTHECMNYIVYGAKRMRQLIDDLLEYSKVVGKDIALVPIDVASALKDAIANLKSTIEKSQAVITYDELPKVMADAAQLKSLFQNLILSNPFDGNSGGRSWTRILKQCRGNNSSRKSRNCDTASASIVTAQSMNSAGIIQPCGVYCRRRPIQSLQCRTGQSSCKDV